MSRRNIVVSIICALLCCTGVTVIFERYQSWTNQAFDELAAENIKAYSDSQNTEVTARVENVRTTMKTIAEMVRQREEAGEGTEGLEEYFDAVSSNEDIQAKGVRYYRFDALDTSRMEARDVEMIEKLKNGESVVSEIYPTEEEDDADFYYVIAEPIYVDGEAAGFIRGLINGFSLLNSSQTGFMRNDTESFLIGEDGTNAFTENLEEESDRDRNVLDSLMETGGNTDKVEALKENIMEKKQKVMVMESEDGPAYVSYSFLPYNDWIILNVFHSKEMNKYVLTLEDNGKKMTALLIGLAAATVLLVAGIVYHSNKEHRFERKRTALLTNFSDMILCEYDRNKDVLRCTSNISRVLAVEQTEITDFKQFIADSELVHPQDHPVLEDMLKRHLKEGETEKYEVRLKAKGNAYIWCRLDIVSIGSKRKRVLVIKVTDISGEKKKEMALMRKAQRDTLSGLLNRGAFKDQVSEYIRQSQGGCLFLIDLDNFKDINDRYGHLAGDESIRKVGEVLRACFRSRDVIGRYGGDEFFAFVPGRMSRDIIDGRAADVIRAVEKITLEEAPDLHFTCSIGIVRCEEGISFHDCLKHADEAMYEAKSRGKNSWIVQ